MQRSAESCSVTDAKLPFLAYGRQWIGDDDAAAVAAALHSDHLTTGPRVAAFERDLASVCGTKHAIAVNSGTAALHAAYSAAGLRPGDELVTSPLTFAATANAALYLGATVRFADVCADTGNLDPAAAAAAISAKTKLVTAVDYAGHPADYLALERVVGKRCAIIADAAHAIGATLNGKPVGTLAALTCLSFHPVKTITTGEGGAVVTNDAVMAASAARFRTHGIERDPAVMPAAEGPWWYEQRELGFNYRITDVQCALGSSQLAKLTRFVDRRRQIAARYTAAFSACAALEVPTIRAGAQPAWHLYPLRVRDATRRRAFFERLRALNLGVQVHYIPVYWHPYYQALGYRRGMCPVAENYYARQVSLPMYPKLTDPEIDSVIERVLLAAKDLL
ncbi:MAG: UDP-4-amino-4,6-dideoxy-N-acetyl-beta-L-altrosamine transaminase [Planctomycetota bacterium]